MKCPKCNEEIEESAKFCTKCGVNIQEEKERKKQKEAEDKKRLEEIRKQEEQKREEELKEAEKAEAIQKAKEEGIELEIIDKKEDNNKTENGKDFKVKKNQENKKKKIKIKKNIFQRLLEKLIFLIIVAAIIIGGVYYCYKQEILPEFAQKEVEDFDEKLQNVINMDRELK